MNERIQELITVYLHRGSTPAQERELFEACKNDPEVAEHLRQHLILSLKLRRLRDDITVEDTLHAAVSRRISRLAEKDAAVPSAVEAPRATGTAHATGIANAAGIADAAAPPRRYGLRHVFGSAVATAAAALLLFLFLPDGGNTPPAQRAEMRPAADTVLVVQRDTVLQVREVERPVYIVRTERVNESDQTAGDGGYAASADNAAGADAAGQTGTPPADQPSELIDAPLPQSTAPDTPALTDRSRHDSAGDDVEGVYPSETDQTEQHSAAATTDRSQLYADAGDPTQQARAEKARNYLEQYNAMLVSVESVQLTREDRVTY